jgi:N-acylglucosamine-6-phosphate 2-epimerase
VTLTIVESAFPILDAIRGSLVVSCQAPEGTAFREPGLMALMAIAAEAGGARGIRAEGAADIAAIKAAVSLPVIGIKKTAKPAGGGVFITPTFATALPLAAAGADIIALDGTPRPRPGGESLRELIARIHGELGLPVMADIDSLDSAEYAQASGADLVGTTLSGYTTGEVPDVADFKLIRELKANIDRPIVAEGRIWSREDAVAAFDAGATTVVVGTAITNPTATTRRFVTSITVSK